MIACDAAVSLCRGHPFPSLQHPSLAVAGDVGLAGFTDQGGLMGLALGPADVAPEDLLLESTLRTGHLVHPLVAALVGGLDTADSPDGGSRTHEDLPIPREGRGALHGQLDGISLPIHVVGVAVDLIQEEIPYRHRAQTHRTVGSGHDQNPPGEFLGQHRIAAVPRTWVLHALPELRAFLDHGSYALLAAALGHLHGGKDHHHGTWGVVDDESQPIVAALRASDLRALHQDDGLHRTGGTQLVHDLPQIRSSGGTPLTGLRTGTLREARGAVGPL